MTQTTMNKAQQLIKSTGLFSGLKDARPRLSSNWIREGEYAIRIDRVKVDTNRKNEASFFVEGTVVFVWSDAQGTGHKLGESVTHNMQARHDSFLSNVKSFLAAALGLPPGDIGDEQVLMVVDDDQPLMNTTLHVKANQVLTRAGKPFTEVNYVREIEPAELLNGSARFPGLSPEAKTVFYPNNLLEQMAAAIEQAAGAA